MSSAAPRADPRGALVPAPAARIVLLGCLAVLGALEWRRLVAGLALERALAWALLAVVVAVAVARARRPRTLALVIAAGLVALWPAAGLGSGRLELSLLDGLSRGTLALGHVRLPYAGSDPWPALTLQLLGAALCLLAGVLTGWPRAGGGRGFPFVALGALLVLVVAPVVALDAPGTALLGLVLAALCVAFLWLERLPLRPGAGVAVLLAVALAGALPVAALTDRSRPWFDYRRFAEAFAPGTTVRFAWDHSYGALAWPRLGTEMVRVAGDPPAYWKVRDLSEFDGGTWLEREAATAEDFDPGADRAPGWQTHPGWRQELQVQVRGLRDDEAVGAGTILSVARSTRPVTRAITGAAWTATGDLRAGDAYTLKVLVPRPVPSQLARSKAGADGRHAADLELLVPFGRPLAARAPRRGTTPPRPVTEVGVHFRPFADGRAPWADYVRAGRRGDGAAALRRSRYARTWALAERLRRGARTPYAYVLAVNRYLQDARFIYTERPPATPRGRAPLDAFLFDTRAGYCQHYSGAMALLLRMGGVPARVAVGFSPGGRSRSKGAWVVRDTDAHSWVEAWFDDVGWVTFDPTPSATPARSQVAALADPIRSRGTGRGPGTTSGRSQSSTTNRALSEATPAATGAGAADDGDGLPAWPLAAGGAAAALLLGLGAWQWPRRRAGDPVAELEAALRRAGRPVRPGTTLRELESRLAGSPEAAAYLAALRSSRYRAHGDPPTAAGRRALRRELGHGLGLSGRLRALWALPPRPGRPR